MQVEVWDTRDLTQRRNSLGVASRSDIWRKTARCDRWGEIAADVEIPLMSRMRKEYVGIEASGEGKASRGKSVVLRKRGNSSYEGEKRADISKLTMFYDLLFYSERLLVYFGHLVLHRNSALLSNSSPAFTLHDQYCDDGRCVALRLLQLHTPSSFQRLCLKQGCSASASRLSALCTVSRQKRRGLVCVRVVVNKQSSSGLFATIADVGLRFLPPSSISIIFWTAFSSSLVTSSSLFICFPEREHPPLLFLYLENGIVLSA
ncbi:unnamed protein product [Caenorhabditis auriculariae]|uniref:Uncharacterized protein n=1 Tax=Caenorhabditis auriculariae TaxID=2777116 RepID=A0A8S1GYA9_9PELO|nr:unnamed protein product [Caenorhabditis auriculariae]